MSPYGRQLILLNSAIILRQMKRYLSSNEQLDNADKRNYLMKSERENVIGFIDAVPANRTINESGSTRKPNYQKT
jgi:hypothetical protein